MSFAVYLRRRLLFLPGIGPRVLVSISNAHGEPFIFSWGWRERVADNNWNSYLCSYCLCKQTPMFWDMFGSSWWARLAICDDLWPQTFPTGRSYGWKQKSSKRHSKWTELCLPRLAFASRAYPEQGGTVLYRSCLKSNPPARPRTRSVDTRSLMHMSLAGKWTQRS